MHKNILDFSGFHNMTDPEHAAGYLCDTCLDAVEAARNCMKSAEKDDRYEDYIFWQQVLDRLEKC